MDQKLTDDALTREQAMEVAHRVGEQPLDHSLERHTSPRLIPTRKSMR